MDTYRSWGISSFPDNSLKTASAGKEKSFTYCYHPSLKDLLKSSQLPYEDCQNFSKL